MSFPELCGRFDRILIVRKQSDSVEIYNNNLQFIVFQNLQFV